MNLASVRISDVWHALGGGPLRGKRGKAFWRDGNGFSIALEPAKGTWFDHRDARGGGVLALVETALGCDRWSALRWLEGEGLIEPRTLTPEQRREQVRRREKARASARDIEHWRCAFSIELNTRKLVATESGDDEDLTRAASLCNVLENGSPKDIVREFIRHLASAPADVTRFVALGEELDQESRRITAEVVLVLARAVESEGLRNVS